MPSVFPSTIARLLFGISASLVVVTGAHASAGTASDALAQALTGEIALQRHLMPQAWKSFMTAAEAAHDSRYAERAWETAIASRSPENAALASRSGVN